MSAVSGMLVLAGIYLSCYMAYWAVLLVDHFLSPAPSPAPGPLRTRFAIVVPAHNEELLLARLLASARGQDYPPERFDTILFAVSANDGGAVYDFTGDSTADLSTIITGSRATGIAVVGGTAVLGDSGSLGNAPTPTPDPSPTPTPEAPKPAYIEQLNLKTNSPVCRTP